MMCTNFRFFLKIMYIKIKKIKFKFEKRCTFGGIFTIKKLQTLINRANSPLGSCFVRHTYPVFFDSLSMYINFKKSQKIVYTKMYTENNKNIKNFFLYKIITLVH